MEALGRDFAFALRVFRRSPLFVAAAVLSLALGIGVNAAVFSLFNALVLRPLPVQHPEQLVHVGARENNGMSHPLPASLLDELRRDPLLQGVCGFTAGDAAVEAGGESLVVATHSLTGDCYRTLGVKPALGRLFTLAEDTSDGPRVAVLGYSFWQTQYHGDRRVLGRRIRISGVSFEIIGVTQPQFRGLLLGYPPAVSAPISQRTSPFAQDPTGRFYWAETLGRLRPGVTARQLELQLETGWRRALGRALPPGFKGANRDELLAMPVTVGNGSTGFDYYFRDHFANALLALLAVSGLVLLITCSNVASLLVARGLEREREIAVRLAMGAARGRIVRQLLAESCLLLLASLLAAGALSWAASRVALNSFAAAYARADLLLDIELDWRVLAFAGGAALLALLIFSPWPAWQTSDLHAAAALRSSPRTSTGRQGQGRRALVSLQLAVTFVVLVCAGVFTHSLNRLREHALHLHRDNVLNAQLMPLPGTTLDGASGQRYLQNLHAALSAIPGVRGVSFSSFAPLVSAPYPEEIRRPDQPAGAHVEAPAEFVTVEFLSNMELPLLQGRTFSPYDTPVTPRTALISASVARQLFPEGSPIGHHVQFGTEPETRNIAIVGVTADAPLEDPHRAQPGFLLLNLSQLPRMAAWGNLQVRFVGDPPPVAAALRTCIQQAGRQTIFSLRTAFELRELSLLQERMLSAAGHLYGALSLLLGAVGLFGLLSFLVSARRSEIAVRMALGANRSDVIWLVIREMLIIAGAGALMGLPLSYAGVHGLAAVIYGTTTPSLSELLPSLGWLLVVAAAAIALPVYRATAVDAARVLRQS